MKKCNCISLPWYASSMVIKQIIQDEMQRCCAREKKMKDAFLIKAKWPKAFVFLLKCASNGSENSQVIKVVNSPQHHLYQTLWEGVLTSGTVNNLSTGHLSCAYRHRHACMFHPTHQHFCWVSEQKKILKIHPQNLCPALHNYIAENPGEGRYPFTT